MITANCPVVMALYCNPPQALDSGEAYTGLKPLIFLLEWSVIKMNCVLIPMPRTAIYNNKFNHELNKLHFKHYNVSGDNLEYKKGSLAMCRYVSCSRIM